MRTDVGVSSPTALTLDGGLSDMREGVFIGDLKPLVGIVRVEADGVRNPGRLSFAGGAGRGDSGRGSEGRRILGLGMAGPGPTDLLKFIADDLTGDLTGVGGVLTTRFVTYLLLFTGTKMPEPGTDVLK